MGRSRGRARAHATFALLVLSLATHAPTAVRAQDSEEVIQDPELSGSSSADSSGSGDETISDPELGEGGGQTDFGWGEVYKPKEPDLSAPEEEEYDPLADTAISKMEVLSQVGADLRHEGGLEDAYETRLRLGGEIEYRRSRNLRLVIGSRLDFFWAVPAQDDPQVIDRKERALDEDRFEVDVFATAAYVDTTVADGVHLRFGQQVVSLGRMDLYSPTDILVVYDLRQQPKMELGSNKLAQPAVRLDWDLASWATLQAVYVPWFQPNLSRPNRDQYVASVTGGPGAALLPERGGKLIDPSFQPKASEQNMRFVGPPPDFSNPQVDARLNFRGNALEFALSGGTALEKTPAVYTTPAVDTYLVNPRDNAAQTAIGLAAQAGQAVVDVEYHRYYLLGFDGSFDIAPVSIGFEFAYSPERHLYAATKDGKHIAQPNISEPITDPSSREEIVGGTKKIVWTPSNVTNRGIRKGVPVVQGAVHLEWLKGETFALLAEAFWINALELPYDKTRDWWGFIPNTGAYVGGMLGLSYMLNEGQWRFEATTITGVGPSVAVVPHIELRAREGLYVDVGAQFFEGPAPGYTDSMGRAQLAGAQNINFGGLLSGYDQVFAGLRWLP